MTRAIVVGNSRTSSWCGPFDVPMGRSSEWGQVRAHSTRRMGEDEHFLARLERLSPEHAELALGLYYDSRLVQHVLRVANVPEGAERVALAFDDAGQGPYVIVSRDGHFVTCLAEGMRVSDEQPVITRHRLDRVSESVEALRGLVAESKSGQRTQTKRRLARLLSEGDRVTREEFEDAARWLPLLAKDFMRVMLQEVDRASQAFDRLARVKKLGSRHEQVIHAYWSSAWAVAHFTLLLGSDGGATVRRIIERLEREIPESALQLPWPLVRLGVTSFAARGAWIASKLGPVLMPALRRRFNGDEASFLTTLTDGLSLMAIGLRHSRYRAEVRKTLAKPVSAKGSAPEVEYYQALRKLFAGYFEVHANDATNPAFRELLSNLSKELLRKSSEAQNHPIDWVERVPDDVATAFFLRLPLSAHDCSRGITSLCEWLPWIVSIDAPAFYMPEVYTRSMLGPWTVTEGMLLLQPRREAEIVRPVAAVAEVKPGRNAPCPCGSGVKYKRCCGRLET